MSITLYLEANFITDKKQNPFFSKLLNSSGDLLYVASSYLQGTDLFIEGKLKATQQFIQTPEENLEEYLTQRGINEDCTVFIDDTSGDLKKNTLTTLLNSSAKAVFILARFDDWLHGEENKYTLSNGFDSFLIARPVITNPQRLIEFVNIFPEAEEKVLDWVEHPRKLPVNSYYVFNKQQYKGVDYFSIYDSRHLNFISLEESKQVLAREDKGQLYFNTINKRIKDLMALVANQGNVLNQMRKLLDLSDQKKLDNSELVSSISENVGGEIKLVNESLKKVIKTQQETEISLEKLLIGQGIKAQEENAISDNMKKTTMEELLG
jgi:hypothetical protein